MTTPPAPGESPRPVPSAPPATGSPPADASWTTPAAAAEPPSGPKAGGPRWLVPVLAGVVVVLLAASGVLAWAFLTHQTLGAAPQTSPTAPQTQPGKTPSAPGSPSPSETPSDPSSPPTSTKPKEPKSPVLVTPPKISGTPQVGQTLTADTGAWKEGSLTFAYQWMICDGASTVCFVISGATQNSYPPGEGDASKFVRVQVSATNSDALATVALSELVGPITKKPEVPVTVTVPRFVGQTLASAQIRAKAANLKLAVASSTDTESCFLRVISQSYAPGTEVLAGTTVTVIVPAVGPDCHVYRDRPQVPR